MKRINIFIDPSNDLHIEKSKYVFRTLLRNAGIPWNFINIPDNSDITYSSNTNIDCKLSIKAENPDLIEKSIISKNIRVVRDKGLIFLESKNKSNIMTTAANQIKIENDFITISYLFLIGFFEETLEKNNKVSFDDKNFILKDLDLLHKPIVNLYSLFIRKFFKATHKHIKPWPNNKSYSVALTHDVDHPQIVKLADAVKNLPRYKNKLDGFFKILFGSESFWKFQEWIKLESEFNMKSAFYFCPKKGSIYSYILSQIGEHGTPDPIYEISTPEFRKVFKYINSKGFEIGMHSSFLAFKSKKKFLDEKIKLEEIAGTKVHGNRHHYWHMDPYNPNSTLKMHSEIGLSYDCSIGMEKFSGFRRGICTPFYPFDYKSNKEINCVQLPTCLMDWQMFDYINFSNFSSYQEIIDSLLASIIENEGLFNVDFHVRVLNDIAFPGWADSYSYLLEKTSNQDFYNSKPSDIANFWVQRQNEIEKYSIS